MFFAWQRRLLARMCRRHWHFHAWLLVRIGLPELELQVTRFRVGCICPIWIRVCWRAGTHAALADEASTCEVCISIFFTLHNHPKAAYYVELTWEHTYVLHCFWEPAVPCQRVQAAVLKVQHGISWRYDILHPAPRFRAPKYRVRTKQQLHGHHKAVYAPAVMIYGMAHEVFGCKNWIVCVDSFRLHL